MIGETVVDGPLVLAMGLALAAGVVSFLSPCVLPLVPGYLAYVTGLGAAEALAAGGASAGGASAGNGGAVRGIRARTLIGTGLFILGFTVVFVSYGSLFGGLGAVLIAEAGLLERIMGGVIIVLGFAYLGAFAPLQRELRFHGRVPDGMWAAPLLGVVFALGWTPCIGPTLAAVQALAFSEGSAGRGALLAAAYAAGLGVPFLLLAGGYRWAVAALPLLRRHQRLLMGVGGVGLICVGTALAAGWWGAWTIEMRGWAGGFTPAL